MRPAGNSFDRILDWTCDGFLALFGLWSLLAQAVVFLGGTGLTLLRLSPLVPIAAVLLLFAGRLRGKAPGGPPRNLSPERPLQAHVPARDIAPPNWPALGFAVVLSVFYVFSSEFILFWAGGCIFLGIFFVSHFREPMAIDAAPPVRKPELAVFAFLACLVLFMALFVHRPHPDDSLYLSVAVEVHDHPEAPLFGRDTLHGIPGMPFLAPQHRFRTYDLLVGQAARLLGLKPIAAAHLLFPPLFALVCLAAAAKLFRRVLGRAWLYGLAAAVLILMVNGDMETTYGNSAFVLLFQGRGVLVAVMVPLLASYALDYMNGTRPVWAGLVFLLFGLAAALGFSTNGLFIGPIVVGLTMAAAWQPNKDSSLRLAAGAAACLFPIALGLALKAGAVPENFYRTSAPSWPLEAARGMNLVLGYRPFMAFWLTALLGAWAVWPGRPARRWMLGFSFFFVLVFMNPALASFWGKNLTSAVTFFRLYWAVPLPFFLAALLAGIMSVPLRPRPGTVRAAVFAAALTAFALLVPSRWTFSPSNSARIGWPGLNVPPTLYRVAEELAAVTPRGGLVLAPETVAAWLPTIPGHPAAVVTREMHLRQQHSRMDEEDYRRRLILFNYFGGFEKALRTGDMETLFVRAVRELDIRGVAVTRSNPWLAGIESMLRARGFRGLPSPSRHFLIFVRPGRD